MSSTNARTGGSIWMVNVDRRLFGWHTRNAVGEFEILGFGNDEKDVAVIAVAEFGFDRFSVVVKLPLHFT
jgi:hypothetical protein